MQTGNLIPIAINPSQFQFYHLQKKVNNPLHYTPVRIKRNSE